MFILKCNMCGGDIEVMPNQTIGVCAYCGSRSVLPEVKDDGVAKDFVRANELRMASRFGDAIEAYNDILRKDSRNAEAHWGALLSRYGVEYVEDPATHKRLPTLHRLRRKSILADDDYRQAVEYAPDAESAQLYREEAQRIEQIQKDALEIVKQEKPFDVFICYKERDESGRLTDDYAEANGLYQHLTQQGYRVFFANITLRGMVGKAYEPYIYAALNSARVMLVLGTRPEYLDAVWVKNEWSRYLELVEEDPSRLMIVCYRDMDPYTGLPPALRALQAVDMRPMTALRDVENAVRRAAPLEKAAPAEPKQDSRELDNARELMASGMFADAARGLDGLAVRYADNPTYWLYRAVAHTNNFDAQQLTGPGMEYLKRAATLAQKNPTAPASQMILSDCQQVANKQQAMRDLAAQGAQNSQWEAQAMQLRGSIQNHIMRRDAMAQAQSQQQATIAALDKQVKDAKRQLSKHKSGQLGRLLLLVLCISLFASQMSDYGEMTSVAGVALAAAFVVLLWHRSKSKQTAALNQQVQAAKLQANGYGQQTQDLRKQIDAENNAIRAEQGQLDKVSKHLTRNLTPEMERALAWKHVF